VGEVWVRKAFRSFWEDLCPSKGRRGCRCHAPQTKLEKNDGSRVRDLEWGRNSTRNLQRNDKFIVNSHPHKGVSTRSKAGNRPYRRRSPGWGRGQNHVMESLPQQRREKGGGGGVKHSEGEKKGARESQGGEKGSKVEREKRRRREKKRGRATVKTSRHREGKREREGKEKGERETQRTGGCELRAQTFFSASENKG